MAYRWIILILLITFSFSLFAQTDYYPRTVVAELFALSDTGESQNAYQGIDNLMNGYSYDEVIPIRFYTSEDNGEYSSPVIESYIQQQSITVFPSLIVNGKSRISNNFLPISSGEPYEYLVEAEYYKPSPVKLEILSLDRLTGEIDIKITMISSQYSLDNATLRFILLENDVAPDITNVARDIQENTFSLTGQNNNVFAGAMFDLSPDWVNDNLEFVVSVEVENETIQAITSMSSQEPHLRAVIPDSRIDIGPSTGVFDGEDFYLYYLGASADFTIDRTIHSAPDSWFLTYCDESGSCFFGELDFSLNNEEYKVFHANVIIDRPGMMEYSFEIISDILDEPYVIPYRYLTNDLEYLIVDGDGWQNYESYTVDILDSGNQSYGVWCTSMAAIEDQIIQHFNKIIWITGEKEPALSHHETDFLRLYLDSGKHLFISGQNIGVYLNDNYLYEDEEFFNDYLNAHLLSSNSDYLVLYGVDSDPITAGMNITLNGGDGADNQIDPEVITVYNQTGYEILHYNGDEGGAIRHTNQTNGSKIVYLAFGFEGINNANDRQQLLVNSLNWFGATNIEEDGILPEITGLELLPGFPNPFVLSASQSGNSNLTIPYRFSLTESDKPRIDVFNIKGQLVKSFTDLSLNDNGLGSVSWNGLGFQGEKVGSGVYFMTLTDKGQKSTRKVLIVR